VLFLKDLLRSAGSADFAGLATWAGMLCAVTMLIGNACKKKWGDIGEFITAMLAAAGAVSGIKIVVLTLTVDTIKLGALAEDRAALVVGGAATAILAMREGAAKWKKGAGF
jgi:hypothetical protein